MKSSNKRDKMLENKIIEIKVHTSMIYAQKSGNVRKQLFKHDIRSLFQPILIKIYNPIFFMNFSKDQS